MSGIDDIAISMSDIRAAGYCPRIRPFFREHGLEADFVALVKGGTMPAGRLLSTDDPRAIHVVNLKLTGVRG